MSLSNFEKYALTEDDIYHTRENVQNSISSERLRNMTNEFELTKFFQTEFGIAVILITPNQVVISYGSRYINHSDLYYYMKNCISEKYLSNPMIELRCASDGNYGICYPVLHSESVVPKQMKEVVRKIHSQFDIIEKKINLFKVEEFENFLNSSKLQEIKGMQQENMLGFSLLEFMKKLDIEKTTTHLQMKSNTAGKDSDFENER